MLDLNVQLGIGILLMLFGCFYLLLYIGGAAVNSLVYNLKKILMKKTYKLNATPTILVCIYVYGCTVAML